MRLSFLIACAGLAVLSASTKSEAGRSGGIPVQTVTQPTHTATYSVPSSDMEPTIHCARPAPGCEAAVSDRVVVSERAVKRGDVVVFQAPRRARLVCGAGGLYVKRAMALPGDTYQEKRGYVYIDGKKLSQPY